MLNYLARLGWSFDATQEIFTRAELIEKFSLDRVNSSPASHDPDKLFWIEGEWMKTLPLEREDRRACSRSSQAKAWSPSRSRRRARRRIEAVILALGDRLKVFSDILKLGRYFFTDTIDLRPRRREEAAPQGGRAGDARASSTSVLAAVEPFDLATLEKAVHDYAERTRPQMGEVVNPLRVATTGQGVGPGLYDCLAILGRETCRARIALGLLSSNNRPPRDCVHVPSPSHVPAET